VIDSVFRSRVTPAAAAGDAEMWMRHELKGDEKRQTTDGRHSDGVR